MYLVMLGAPGSGKGTVAKKLEENLNIVHISSGDIFREHIRLQDERGKQINEYVSKGELVPDEVTIGMIEDRLEKSDAEKGAILDGFPRTEKQAIVLSEFLEKKGKKVDCAVELDIPDEVIIERLSMRRSCPKCNEIYNLKSKPPKRDGICDKCGNEIVQREDDNPETIKNRLQTYYNSSKELINYYQNQNQLLKVKIDENTTPEITLRKILEHLK